MNKGEVNSKDIAAYIPCYEDGNAVRAIRKDSGETVIQKGIKYVVKDILKECGLDIRSLKRFFSPWGLRSNLFPIPTSLSGVLIPVKVRKAIGKNDGSFAYLDLHSIESVKGDKQACIWLKPGQIIECLENVRTVKRRMAMGGEVLEKYAFRMAEEQRLLEGMEAIGLEYGKAATRGDIALLQYEMMLLRKSLDKKV